MTEIVDTRMAAELEARWQTWRANRVAQERAAERRLFRRLPLLMFVIAIAIAMAYLLLAG